MNTQAQATWWRHPPAPEERGATVSPSSGNSLPFWALMAFTAILLLSPQEFVHALAPLHLALLAAMLAGGAYVVGALLRRQRVLRFTPEVSLAFGLAAWALATTPLSSWPGGSVTFFFDIYFKALVVFWLLANIVDSVPKLRMAAWILSLIAVPLSVAAVKSFFSGGFHGEELSHGLDRIRGYGVSLTGNPNDLALMLNLILPLSIALMLASRSAALRCLLGALMVLDVIAIIASFSRAGFLVLAVTCLAYLTILIRRRRRTLVLLVIVGVLLSLPLLPSAYLDRLSTITHIQADQTGSAQIRLNDSLTAAKYVAAHPFIGAGIGMNILALNEVRGATWTKVHNVYLEYAVDLGLPGLVLFLLLLRRVVKGVWRVSREAAEGPAHHELHCLAQGLGVSLLGFIVAAFFYPDAYQFYFYYIAGLAVAAAYIADSARFAPDTEGYAAA